LLGGFQPRNDAFFQEAGDEHTHLEFGAVGGGTGSGHGFAGDSSKGFKDAQTLADGTLAHPGAGADDIDVQRLVAGEEQAVQDAVGAAWGECRGSARECQIKLTNSHQETHGTQNGEEAGEGARVKRDG